MAREDALARLRGVHDCTFIASGSTAEQLYGYPRDEALGKVTHSLLRTEVTGGVAALESALSRYGVWIGELRHASRDGGKVEVEARLSLMSQQNGRWLVLEVNRDVTDRHAAESARRRIEKQLAELRTMIDSRPGCSDDSPRRAFGD